MKARVTALAFAAALIVGALGWRAAGVRTLLTDGPRAKAALGCTCGVQKNDPYEEPRAFADGPFRGQCVDSCRFRRATLLHSLTGQRYGADADHTVIANFLHAGRFWIARIPLATVQHVDLGFEKFLWNIAHVFIRIRFSPRDPVLLYAQKSGSPIRAVHALEDLVISAEGVPPRNHPYDFVESALGRYLFAYRVLSVPEVESWMLDLKKHEVKQTRLNLKPDARSRLLTGAFSTSEAASFEKPYRLLDHNCATAATAMVAEAVHYRTTFPDQILLTEWQRAVPLDSAFGTAFALKVMKLIDREAILPDLATERSKRPD